jgi:uncharacterized Zn-finger protein
MLFVHTDGEKEFECPVCHKKLTTSQGLRNHTVLHSGNRQYRCDSCTKTFVSRGTLNQHFGVCPVRKVEIKNLEREQLVEKLKLKRFQKEKGELLKQKLQIEQKMLDLENKQRLATKSINDVKVSICKLAAKKL